MCRLGQVFGNNPQAFHDAAKLCPCYARVSFVNSDLAAAAFCPSAVEILWRRPSFGCVSGCCFVTDDPAQIFHVCRRSEWEAALLAGCYAGSSQDQADGFIHFSGRDQVVRSAAKHRAGQTGLVLLVVDSAALGSALKWEPSRSGKLVPHLYGGLSLAAVVSVHDLPLGDDGLHRFPPGIG